MGAQRFKNMEPKTQQIKQGEFQALLGAAAPPSEARLGDGLVGQRQPLALPRVGLHPDLQRLPRDLLARAHLLLVRRLVGRKRDGGLRGVGGREAGRQVQRLLVRGLSSPAAPKGSRACQPPRQPQPPARPSPLTVVLDLTISAVATPLASARAQYRRTAAAGGGGGEGEGGGRKREGRRGSSGSAASGKTAAAS